MALTDVFARQESRDVAPTPSGAPEPLTSQVMSQVLAQVDSAAPLVVLDAGFGMPETVDYFESTGRHCRLHFLGLQESVERGLALDEEGRSRESWRLLFAEALEDPREQHFDLLLFWDFFNFLDDSAVRAFNDALDPFIDSHSHGHGFLAPNTNTSLPGRRYSLQNSNCIMTRPGAAPFRDIWQRPHGRLNNLLDSLTIGHSVLRHGGLVEFSLKGIR